MQLRRRRLKRPCLAKVARKAESDLSAARPRPGAAQQVLEDPGQETSIEHVGDLGTQLEPGLCSAEPISALERATKILVDGAPRYVYERLWHDSFEMQVAVRLEPIEDRYVAERARHIGRLFAAEGLAAIQARARRPKVSARPRPGGLLRLQPTCCCCHRSL